MKLEPKSALFKRYGFFLWQKLLKPQVTIYQGVFHEHFPRHFYQEFKTETCDGQIRAKQNRRWQNKLGWNF